MENFDEAEQRIQKALQADAVELDLSRLGLVAVLDAIAQLTNLQILDLSENQLTSLPEGMQQLTQLEGLYLYGNDNLNLGNDNQFHEATPKNPTS